MKRPDNTEMDRLLRRHARLGGGTPLAASGATSAGSHLDADEMSAYAEGALPEAARAHYFTHLADCDTCRELVTQLTLAANVAGQGLSSASEVASAPSKSWRERLAAIFSPPVLRYAVPALALFAVIIVVIVAMRSQRDASFVARNEQTESGSAQAVAPNSNLNAQPTPGIAESHANTAITPLAAPSDGSQPDATPATPLVENAPVEKGVIPPAGTTSARPAVAQTEDSSTGAREAEQDRSPAPEEMASAPPPAPQPTVLATPAPSADETGARDRQEEPKRAKAPGKDDSDDTKLGENNTAPGTATDKTEISARRNDVGRAAAGSRAPRSQTPLARKRGPASMGAGNERAAETRSVGGRSFQRRDGAWVDTAYSSSSPTTNVRRGSDQYRALVADEPPLRNFAEQLSGEVIVVWKSRAYRFY